MMSELLGQADTSGSMKHAKRFFDKQLPRKMSFTVDSIRSSNSQPYLSPCKKRSEVCMEYVLVSNDVLDKAG
jgi:hypothetical protein